jgi:myo-inositol-1(or 4)-monophosphatase
MVAVAQEAGREALKLMGTGVSSWSKAPGQVVTEADIALNRMINARLLTLRPDYGWLSEEDERAHIHAPHRPVFLVDPIDGTKAFVRGEPGYCVSIALIVEGRPLAGVLVNPMTGETFCALAGAGATCNGTIIRTSAALSLADCRLVGQSRIFRDAHKWPSVRHLEPAPNSIAYRIALVAAGACDAAVSLGEKADWDLAAADLILTEAGGRACDRRGRAIVYGLSDPVKAGVVAAGANLHPLIMDAVLNANAPA